MLKGTKIVLFSTQAGYHFVMSYSKLLLNFYYIPYYSSNTKGPSYPHKWAWHTHSKHLLGSSCTENFSLKVNGIKAETQYT